MKARVAAAVADRVVGGEASLGLISLPREPTFTDTERERSGSRRGLACVEMSVSSSEDDDLLNRRAERTVSFGGRRYRTSLGYAGRHSDPTPVIRSIPR